MSYYAPKNRVNQYIANTAISPASIKRKRAAFLNQLPPVSYLYTVL